MRHYDGEFRVLWANKINDVSINKRSSNCLNIKFKSHDTIFLNKKLKFKLKNISSDFNLKTKNLIVLASGPTAKNFEQENFLLHDIAYLNGAIRLNRYFEEDIQQYHFVSDPNFIQNNVDIFNANSIKNLRFIYSVRAFYELYKRRSDFVVSNIDQFTIFDQINEPFGKQRLSGNQISKLNSKSFCFLNDKRVGYSFDSDLGFFDGRTILYPCLQIVNILGYKNINLFGVDMNSQSRFYESKLFKSKAPSYLDRDFEDQILPSMELISSYFSKNSIKILNHSKNSRIPSSVFKKID